MNIFVLDTDPVTAAVMQCDKHVVKMIVETAQMLCTAHHALDDTDWPQKAGLYMPCFAHHPCTKWVMASTDNYRWTKVHLDSLMAEYTFRYKNIHTTQYKLGEVLEKLPKNILYGPLTEFAQAMPDNYKDPDPVKAYRTYYKNDKAYFAKWLKGRSSPYWWNSEVT